MDISISQFPEHVGKETSDSWSIPQFHLLMRYIRLAIKIPGEDYAKSVCDIIAFFPPLFALQCLCQVTSV